MSSGVIVLKGRCPKGVVVLVGNWQRGNCPTELLPFLAYCLYIRPILQKWQGKVGFAPIDFNAVAGPPLPIAICRKFKDAQIKRNFETRLVLIGSDLRYVLRAVCKYAFTNLSRPF